MQGGGGSPEQSHEVVSERQLSGNYEESSARRAKPRFRPQARALAFNAKGGEPASHGFTMAEILLSLTIIGVVAAITLPSLTGNINERTWNTQRKALYARMSQAIALMPALNGYGTLTEGNESTSAVDTAAETFVTEGLSKVLKINNICDSEHLADCGVPEKVIGLNGNIAFSSFPRTLVTYNNMFNGIVISDDSTTVLDEYHQTDTKAAAFETVNGESIVVYYSPNCKGYVDSTVGYYTQAKMCANFVYDLNGSKGPNTVGKDIGVMTALYSSDSVVVAPLPIRTYTHGVTYDEAVRSCKNLDSESRLPTKEELASIFYNKTLFNLPSNSFWSGSTIATGSINAWLITGYGGFMWNTTKDYTPGFLCVKR